MYTVMICWLGENTHAECMHQKRIKEYSDYNSVYFCNYDFRNCDGKCGYAIKITIEQKEVVVE